MRASCFYIFGQTLIIIKERCGVFSSLHRLAKDYTLIRPIQLIELRILENCVQKCSADLKKPGKCFI
jgi:hypothetical protein